MLFFTTSRQEKDCGPDGRRLGQPAARQPHKQEPLDLWQRKAGASAASHYLALLPRSARVFSESGEKVKRLQCVIRAPRSAPKRFLHACFNAIVAGRIPDRRNVDSSELCAADCCGGPPLNIPPQFICRPSYCLHLGGGCER